jgi:hypothetical protein
MVIRRFPMLLVLTAVLSASPLAAQTESDVDAYYTLLGTPSGSLSPLLPRAMLGRAMATPSVAIRYGRVTAGGIGFDNVAATLAIPVGSKVQLGVTGEHQRVLCPTGIDTATVRREWTCSGHLMLGANAEARLASITIGATPRAPRLTFGVNGDIGFARPYMTKLLSLAGGVPVAVVLGGPSFTIAPFVTPGIAWGQVQPTQGLGDSQTLSTLAGGISFANSSHGIAANVGFQKVSMPGAHRVIGASVIFGR